MEARSDVLLLGSLTIRPEYCQVAIEGLVVLSIEH
jgi:hypothetical protein